MPTRAISLKHIRQSPKCLMYARGLPQRLQRLYSRTGKRFGFFQLAILDFFAKIDLAIFLGVVALRYCLLIFGTGERHS